MVCHRSTPNSLTFSGNPFWRLVFRKLHSWPKVTEPSSFRRTRSLFQLSLWVPLGSFKSGVKNQGPRPSAPSVCFYEVSLNMATPIRFLPSMAALVLGGQNLENSICNKDDMAPRALLFNIRPFPEKVPKPSDDTLIQGCNIQGRQTLRFAATKELVTPSARWKWGGLCEEGRTARWEEQSIQPGAH